MTPIYYCPYCQERFVNCEPGELCPYDSTQLEYGGESGENEIDEDY